MKDFMNAKLFLKNNMPWCAVYNYITLEKITLKKPYLLYRKVSAPERHRYLLYTCFKPTVQSQHTNGKSTLRRSLF